jgi:ATP-binding cassette subfamily B protein
VVLLDEATSAIDALTESAIRQALRAISRDRAVITIAHRLATAREADRVIVLDDGRIIEEGKPEVLLTQGGRFAAMVQLEAAGWELNGLEGN